MSDRRFDMSGLQITASVLAAVSGAVLASYLGVAGTIIGTAVMSVAGTAGTAVYKHYLGSTAKHLKETATVAAAHRATEWMSVGTRTAVVPGAAGGHTGQHGAAPGTGPPSGTWPPGGTGPPPDSEASRDTGQAAGTGITHGGAPGTAGGTGSAGDTDAAGDTAPGGTGQGDGAAAPRAGWRAAVHGRLARWRAAMLSWPMWLKLATASAVVFVGVIGAVSVVEAVAGKPLQTVVWNHKASGTTVGNIGGRPAHSTRPASPGSSPSGTTSSSPTPASNGTGSASPTPSPSPSSPSPSPSGESSPPVSSSPGPSATATGLAKGGTG